MKGVDNTTYGGSLSWKDFSMERKTLAEEVSDILKCQAFDEKCRKLGAERENGTTFTGKE